MPRPGALTRRGAAGPRQARERALRGACRPVPPAPGVTPRLGWPARHLGWDEQRRAAGRGGRWPAAHRALAARLLGLATVEAGAGPDRLRAEPARPRGAPGRRRVTGA